MTLPTFERQDAKHEERTQVTLFLVHCWHH